MNHNIPDAFASSKKDHFGSIKVIILILASIINYIWKYLGMQPWKENLF